MSLRYIPYGYKFEDGRPVPHSDESQIVQEIFTRYCSGDSLKAIAEGLTQRHIEYIPGKTDWNKARIKRILENSRYAGEDGYPAIIAKEQFVAANLMKDNANKSKVTVDPEIKLFKEYIVCAGCGSPVKRRVDSRFVEPVFWKCEKCGWSVKLGDDALKARVTRLKKPDCPLIGEDGNIFNLLGIAARTLRENGMVEQASKMMKRATASGSYDEALCVIGEYVNITSAEDAEMGQEFGGM